MSTRRRPYRKNDDRHIWVFSEPNQHLAPEELAKLLARAAFEDQRRDQVKRTAQSTEGDDHAA